MSAEDEESATHDKLLDEPSWLRGGHRGSTREWTRTRAHERTHTRRTYCSLKCICCFVVTALLVGGWAVAAYLICTHCYRIGNFLDAWAQREMSAQWLLELDTLTNNSNRTSWTVTSGEVHRSHEIRTPEAFDAFLYRIYRGVVLRRTLRFEWLWSDRTLIQVAWSTHVPRTLTMPTLAWRNRVPSYGGFMLYTNYEALVPLVPYLRPAYLELLHHIAANRTARASAGTVVIHYRVGDSHDWKKGNSTEIVKSLVHAALDFTPAPRRFEILEGGASHACDVPDSCGWTLLRLLASRLRATFPNTTTVFMTGLSADESFVRVATAPMLITGGGSFAIAGAIACTGQVRTPQCMLGQNGECAKGRLDLTAQWRLYHHPQCEAACHSSRRTLLD